VKLKRMNSLKQAVINDTEETSQHSQALQELLHAIDNPTIPKYQPLTSDSALYIKSQSKKNIALDVVDERVEEEVAESKPMSPISSLQKLNDDIRNGKNGQNTKISREKSLASSQSLSQSNALSSNQVSSKDEQNLRRSDREALGYNSNVSEAENKSFKSSKQSARQANTE
jgi:hypothetical protein